MDLHALAQAFALGAVCTIPVFLWCGFEVGRFGLSHSAPILRRALGIYAISAILALALVAIAVVGGVAKEPAPAAALGQIFFVALAATLVLGAFIATLKATGYLIKKLRMRGAAVAAVAFGTCRRVRLAAGPRVEKRWLR